MIRYSATCWFIALALAETRPLLAGAGETGELLAEDALLEAFTAGRSRNLYRFFLDIIFKINEKY